MKTETLWFGRRMFLAGVAAVLLVGHGRIGRAFQHRSGWVLHGRDF